MASTTPRSPHSDTKEPDPELRQKLQEAYERGATEEATRFLLDEFQKRREAYSQQLKALRREVGL